MFTLIIGGSASGKSEYAEQHVLSLPVSEKIPLPPANTLNRIYIATMQPFGEDALARIARHHAMRKDRGFVTIERYTDLSGLRIPEGSSVLLEDLGNLVANEMFSENEDTVVPSKDVPIKREESLNKTFSKEAFSNEAFSNEATSKEMDYERAYSRHFVSPVAGRILRGVEKLLKQCSHLTIVTNEVFSDGKTYEKETLHYLRELAAVNRLLAARADHVVEVVCGIPNVLK